MSEDKKTKKRTVTFSPINEQAADLLAKTGEFERIKEDSLEFITSDGQEKKKKPPRLAVTYDPKTPDNYQGVKVKRKLIPDETIKEIRATDHLIASILRARGNTISMFGHIKKDRFDIGIEVKIKPEFEKELTYEELIKVKERISRFESVMISCGKSEGLKESEKMGLPEFLDIQVRNGLSFGRFATEVVYDGSGDEHEELGKFHRFRPVDAATIKRTQRLSDNKNEAVAVRKASASYLSRESDEKVEVEEIDPSEIYPWAQQIDGNKYQFFSEKEMIVYNLYPSTDVEHNGYPLTPIDTCMSSVITHLSIEAYNKLYFQNGRAAKGMLVIKSDEIDQESLNQLKQEYYSSINNVGNSFRTPIFGITPTDDVSWVGTDGTTKDGEFQFLYDSISRNILAAFNMSPDELPGYGHLSRGTNQQSLSESNNEFKLSASRDTGLRPLILKIQDFLNGRLFPIIDSELSQLCVIQLSGLDAQSRDQESVRLAQEAPLHMSQDDIQSSVDKDSYGPHLSGKFPLSERFQLLLDKYHDVGQLMSDLNGNPSAFVDPVLRYKRDGFYFQHLQILMQVNPSVVQALFARDSDLDMEILKLYLEDYLEEMDQ